MLKNLKKKGDKKETKDAKPDAKETKKVNRLVI